MDVVKRLHEYLADRGEKGWLVGGAVRDLLLGHQPDELDIVTTVSPASLPESVWAGARSFFLDEPRGVIRVLAPVPIDLAPCRGTLQDDLAARDFTINAIAMELGEWIGARQEFFDPLGGMADVETRRLHLASATAMQDDPVRILRGVRLSLTHDLTASEECLADSRRAAVLLAAAPGERLWSELQRILIQPRSAAGLQHLSALGATQAMLPELVSQQGVTQNRHHQFTVDEHTRRAFEAFSEVIHQGRYLKPHVAEWAFAFWSHLPPELQGATMLGAWLHDVGKPATRRENAGKVTFYGHEQIGADMAEKIAERFRLSRAQRQLLRQFIRYHMYPLQLWRGGKLDGRLLHRFYRKTGWCGVLIVLFTVADHLAKGEDVAATDAFEDHMRVVELFLRTYFTQEQEVINPPPLLSGDELMELLQAHPGPWLGELKAALSEAQAGGEISSKEQAVAFARRYRGEIRAKRNKVTRQ